MSMNQLLWRSRRGVLELDLILEQFLKAQGETLSAEEQQAYEALLDCADPLLISWIAHQEPCDAVEHQAIVAKILSDD